jgi:hypothetical protein
LGEPLLIGFCAYRFPGLLLVLNETFNKPTMEMPKQSALILAIGFIIGCSILYLGLSKLAEYVFLAGRAAEPPHQIDVQVTGSGFGEPVRVLTK